MSVMCYFITLIFVQVHYVFQHVLSEIKQIYHGENDQPLSTWGLFVMDR
jgi:hypothetical protein